VAVDDPKERLSKTVSDAELERRWKAVREVMREKKIDYLVMQNQEEYMGGNLRWFSDFTARHQFPMTVIFPVDDDMTLINCGAQPSAPQTFPPPWFARGIKNRLGDVYFLTMPYTNTYDAKLAVDVLKEKKNPTIGWVERSFIPVTFYEYLVENLPGATFVDATEWVDELRTVKSEEEVELIRGTAALQDACVEFLKKTIKPGMRDYEVYAEAHYFLSKNGSERGLVQVGSGPLGTIVPFDIIRFGNRVIREDDQVSVLIEVNGPGGYYTEMMRQFAVGAEPPQSLLDAWAIAVEAQDKMAEMLRPGAHPKDIWDMYVEFITKAGYAPPVRSIAHGQGYSLVERPNIRPDETMRLKEGMNIVLHPSAVRQGVWTIVGGNYIIRKDGAESLNKSPREIIAI
jgi:Xaa-Pro aminopeptidase